jgi:hypothetical protein
MPLKVKDRRYAAVRHLIKDGRIRAFNEIFEILPKTVLAKSLGINNSRFERLRNNISLFQLREIFFIANILEINEEEILNLVYAQYLLEKKQK